MRIVITGSPKAGKSTLAGLMARIMVLPAMHTDEVSHLEWSAASEAVSEWFDEPGPWIMEGVTVPRALRKWKNRNPVSDPPFDWFILMREPRGLLTETGQETMRKQVVGLAELYKDWIGERWIEL